MIKTTPGMVSAATILLLAASFANVSAQTKKSDSQSPACTQLKEDTICRPRRLPVGGGRREAEGRLRKVCQKGQIARSGRVPARS